MHRCEHVLLTSSSSTVLNDDVDLCGGFFDVVDRFEERLAVRKIHHVQLGCQRAGEQKGRYRQGRLVQVPDDCVDGSGQEGQVLGTLYDLKP